MYMYVMVYRGARTPPEVLAVRPLLFQAEDWSVESEAEGTQLHQRLHLASFRYCIGRVSLGDGASLLPVWKKISQEIRQVWMLCPRQFGRIVLQ